MRQVVLDTETTGLDPTIGHRVIEIGCVELVNRRLTDRTFHAYINPDRMIDQEAFDVHGISNEFLADKQRFTDIADQFIEFISGAELIAHNAPFDIRFLEAELERIPKAPILSDLILGGKALDTLRFAREKRPGKRNSLDALCRDFKVDASERTLHGALLDAELLSLVYLAMTREQANIFVTDNGSAQHSRVETVNKFEGISRRSRIHQASEDEALNHAALIEHMRKEAIPLWDKQ